MLQERLFALGHEWDSKRLLSVTNRWRIGGAVAR